MLVKSVSVVLVAPEKSHSNARSKKHNSAISSTDSDYSFRVDVRAGDHCGVGIVVPLPELQKDFFPSGRSN